VKGAGLILLALIVYKLNRWFGLIFLISLAKLIKNMFSDARKLMVPNAHLLLDRDRRPPVLYLRSFQDDGSYARNTLLESLVESLPLSTVSRRHSYEERLVKIVWCVGPVIAFGRPGEPLPELGAARMYLPNLIWKREILELMRSARLIILRMGPSAGLKWELSAAAAAVRPERLILYFEPRGAFSECLKEFWSKLPVSPSVLTSKSFSRARFIHFEPNWTPHPASTLRGVLKNKNLYKIQLKSLLLWCIVLISCSLLAWLIVKQR
jgi:hypothetical protein